MAKSRKQKEEQVQYLASQLKNAKSVVFANYQGLSVADTEILRGQCREQGIACVAAKKTIVKLSLKDAGAEIDTKAYNGGILAFFGSDEVDAPKTVATFAKAHETMSIFGGMLEGTYIDSEKVVALSALPSKEQLLGRLVGTINAPLSGFVNVLAGNIRSLVTVLNGIKDAKA